MSEGAQHLEKISKIRMKLQMMQQMFIYKIYIEEKEKNDFIEIFSHHQHLLPFEHHNYLHLMLMHSVQPIHHVHI